VHFCLFTATGEVLLLFIIVCIMLSTLLLMEVLFFGVKSSFYESPLGGHGSLMRSYVTFYCVHTVHSRYDITSMDDVVYILRRIRRRSS
jgi:hypothetical protein